MNNRRSFLVVFIILLLVSGEVVMAGSIWARKDRNSKDYYSDDVARNIGDILTIKIDEDSKVDKKGKRDLKKETDRSSAFNGKLGINGVPAMPGFTMSAETSNELKSKADFKDERSFVDSITVVVVDILPNGHLVVMGTRNRDIAGDIQIIEASGIVRVNDITFDNTIKSEQVADFRIVVRNEGVSEPYTKPGWLGRIMDILWPF
jgi:flagellar L-ring protein precursor FlgH